MNTLETTHHFSEWLHALSDGVGKVRILRRLSQAEAQAQAQAQAQAGNFGDCGAVGGEVSEMRIHYGPGYRVYFTRTGSTVYLLLAGGDKSSQQGDIRLAQEMARTLRGEP